MDALIATVDALAREAMLFAAIGLLIGGADELLVDVLYAWTRLRRGARPMPSALPPPTAPGCIVTFVPAWDELAVIGPMLRTALSRWGAADHLIYVGAYPNDPATIDAVAAVARDDGRVRLVVGPRNGPTTKADNLNVLWRALRGDGVEAKAIVIHDAEDVVHPAEPRIFAGLIERYDAVQLPVQPLIDRGARFVSGYVADEFAESHGKAMVVRGAIGAGLPLAGTGCALSPAILTRLAAERGGDPFDADSLVEDYELGLRIAALGGRGVFARIDDGTGGVVSVRSLFPRRIAAAVRQKARWTAGIALAGWDRVGWSSQRLALADHWWRARDRRAPLATLVLAAAYLAGAAWVVGQGLHALNGTAPDPYAPTVLIAVNTALLAWRAAVRAAFTASAYGWREGVLSVPRMLVGNWIALLATPKAIARYVRSLRGEQIGWDKTAHRFPPLPRAEAGS